MTIERTAMGYPALNPASPLAEPPIYEPAADIMRIVGVVRRQYKLALLGAVLGGLLAVFLLLVLQPSYKSTIRILLDQDRTRLLNDISGEQEPVSTDEYMATQIAIVTSDIVARRMIHNLGLVYDPDTRRLSIAPKPSEKGTQARPTRVTSEYLAAENIDPALIDAVQRAVSVYQVDKGLVVEITANDPDPDVAQKMAAAYGEAYLTDQLSARFEATKSAGSWLEERINSLREESEEANNAVEKFRAENNLVSTDGRLVSDQQLGSLNEQLVAARLDVTRAAAKVDVFKTALEKNDVNAIISIVGSATEISDTAPIKALRSDYLEVAQRSRDVAARWGSDNDQAKILQAEVARQSGLVLDEAKRILEGFQSELRTAEREAEATAAAVTSATSQSKTDNSTLVALRSLEQRSAASNALYQAYLARYQEAVQQQTLSLTTGRLISSAELPGLPVFPNQKVIFAFLLLLGGGAGGAFGVGRELLDRTFRTRGDVERFGLDFLGYVAGQGTRGARKRFDLSAATEEKAGFVTALAEAVDKTGSALDTIRTGIEIRRRGSSRVVAMVSLDRNPSRSALTLALAAREARSGRNVLLVDGDHEEGLLSRALASGNAGALSEVLAGRISLGAAAETLEAGLRFLPIAKGADAARQAVSIPAEQLKAWALEFDLVVIDLPPAGPISEARALAPAVDAYVCAVRWGETPRQLLPALIHSSSSLKAKMVGVVVTDVNMKRQYLYDAEAVREARRRVTV